MTSEELQATAFQIISCSGDSFADFYEAIEEALDGNYNRAQELIQSGEKTLIAAHKAQTDLLVAEASGEELNFGIIMIHAQDHLMTTMNYQRIAKQMIKICERLK